jgi:hypothetical protein
MNPFDNSIGDQLEKAGWRQGSILNSCHLEDIISIDNYPDLKNLVLIVASQSCDIANNNLHHDPYIEISIARKIESINGNLSFNKNPRMLHLALTINTENTDIYEEQAIELIAYEKIRIPKNSLVSLKPDPLRIIETSQLDSYVYWLAARYSRPALPTEFNKRVAAADPKDKRKKKAKNANNYLSGIYVEIFPDREISADENYRINLLGLISIDFTGNITEAKDALNDYECILKNAGMDVTVKIANETEVSIAVIKRFKRFYYDDLSIKNKAPLPPETEVIM